MLSLKEMELESYSSVDDTDERGQAQKSCKEITYQDLLKLQELSLLQWIVRYDSIRLIETDNKGAVVIVVVVVAIIMLVVILFNLYIKTL